MTLDANAHIREAMRDALRRQNLTQAQLAALLGVSQPAVTQLLSGAYGGVPQSLLRALEVLGLELRVVPGADPEGEAKRKARAEALALLSVSPWGKKPAGLSVPVPFEGPPFEKLLAEHRGRDE